MTKQEKKEFIEGIIEQVKITTVNKIDKMPESWDGAHLRMYIADQFSQIVWGSMKGLRRKFNNDVIVNGL